MPKRRKGLKRKKRILFLGGHYHGCNALDALCTMDTLKSWSEVVGVWCDYNNNVARRLYRHYDDPDFEQRRILERCELHQIPAERTLFEQFDGEKLCRLIEEWEIDILVVATFGGLIPQKAIDLVKGNCFICHPCFELPDGAKYLPAESRGARVMDRLVSSANKGVVQIEIALLRATDRFDEGPVLATTYASPGISFAGWEWDDDQLPLRVHHGQVGSAGLVGALIRYNLMHCVLSAKEAREAGFTWKQLIKRNYSEGELEKAGKKPRKR